MEYIIDQKIGIPYILPIEVLCLWMEPHKETFKWKQTNLNAKNICTNSISGILL